MPGVALEGEECGLTGSSHSVASGTCAIDDPLAGDANHNPGRMVRRLAWQPEIVRVEHMNTPTSGRGRLRSPSLGLPAAPRERSAPSRAPLPAIRLTSSGLENTATVDTSLLAELIIIQTLARPEALVAVAPRASRSRVLSRQRGEEIARMLSPLRHDPEPDDQAGRILERLGKLLITGVTV